MKFYLTVYQYDVFEKWIKDAKYLKAHHRECFNSWIKYEDKERDSVILQTIDSYCMVHIVEQVPFGFFLNRIEESTNKTIVEINKIGVRKFFLNIKTKENDIDFDMFSSEC